MERKGISFSGGNEKAGDAWRTFDNLITRRLPQVLRVERNKYFMSETAITLFDYIYIHLIAGPRD